MLGYRCIFRSKGIEYCSTTTFSGKNIMKRYAASTLVKTAFPSMYRRSFSPDVCLLNNFISLLPAEKVAHPVKAVIKIKIIMINRIFIFIDFILNIKNI